MTSNYDNLHLCEPSPNKYGCCTFYDLFNLLKAVLTFFTKFHLGKRPFPLTRLKRGKNSTKVKVHRDELLIWTNSLFVGKDIISL